MMDKGIVRIMSIFNLNNTFEKLVHLVGFVTQIYRDARPHDLQHC
jgi:hypothetical protein